MFIASENKNVIFTYYNPMIFLKIAIANYYYFNYLFSNMTSVKPSSYLVNYSQPRVPAFIVFIFSYA